MTALLWLLLVVAAPSQRTVCVDAIERNAVYSVGTGETTLVQFIFWELTPDGYRCRDWRVAKDCGGIERSNGRYRLSWTEGRLRLVVLSSVYQETLTPHDVEIADRECWPVHLRRRLY